MLGRSDWIQHHGVHLLTLYPPGGGARIRVYERLRPLLRASQVLSRVLGDDPPFRIARLGRAEPLITSEGEHGAWVSLEGTRDGVWVRRAVGMIFTDEFVVAVDALATQPERWDEIDLAARDIVASTELGLGVRRRRYVYTSPPGWTALARGLVGYFYPPDFPHNPSLLAVHPASPVQGFAWDPEPARLLVELTEAMDSPERVDTRAYFTPTGLEGKHYVLAGAARRSRQRIVRHAIVLHRAPYVYAVRLDEPRGDDSSAPEVLAAVARSIVPVPDVAPRIIPRSSAAFGHWAD